MEEINIAPIDMGVRLESMRKRTTSNIVELGHNA